MHNKVTNRCEGIMIHEGKKVPDFSFEATSGMVGTLEELLGRPIILYFYPKDYTPGCTCEAEDFRDAAEKWSSYHAVVLGVSRDALTSHESFKTKLKLPFELIVDKDEKLCTLFDVIKMKKMYGKEVRGIVRSTFLIDSKGVLVKAWRNVKVDGHVQEVCETLATL